MTVAGAAVYATRNTKLVRRRVIAPVAGLVSGALNGVIERLDEFAQPDPKSARARQLDDEASLDDLDIATHDIVEQLGFTSASGSTIGDAVDLGTTDLVEAERELLTVAGQDHRRRRQTAGAAAQEIAAAQVRERRNGVDAGDWER